MAMGTNNVGFEDRMSSADLFFSFADADGERRGPASSLEGGAGKFSDVTRLLGSFRIDHGSVGGSPSARSG